MAIPASSLTSLVPKSPSRPALRLLAGGNAKNVQQTRTAAIVGAYPAGRVRRMLSPRRPAERALLSVIQETYISGRGTRAVDAMVERFGIEHTAPALVEAEAREWDRRVEAFRRRRLRQPFPFLLVAETSALVRAAGSAVMCGATVAVGVTESGRKEVIGLAVRPIDASVQFWESFFRDLKDRGLHDVKVVTSDRIEGLVCGLAAVFSDVRWQWCRERFIGEMLRLVPRTGRPAVESALRGALAQPDPPSARRALARVRAQFEFAFADLVDALDAPLEAVLTSYSVDARRRRDVASLNALTSLQHDLRRASELIGIFPNEQALLRLSGAIVEEFSDEWAAYTQRSGRRSRGAAAALAGVALAQAWAA